MNRIRFAPAAVLAAAFLLAAPCAAAAAGKAATRPAAAENAGKIAHMRLAGPVLSAPPQFSLLPSGEGNTLRDWLLRLGKARNDPAVTAVALEIDDPGLDWSQAQELADAVARLNEAKPVYAHVADVGAVPFLVASAARHVAIDPSGELEIVGLGGELMFFRGTLDWIGVKPQMIQVGKYKGAAEPFTRTEPSPELKQEYEKLFDDLYAQLCGQLARHRGLTDAQARKAVDAGPLTAQAARQHRLVDALVPAADWKAHVIAAVARSGKPASLWAGEYGKKDKESLDLGNPFALLRLLVGGPPSQEPRDPTIAIVHAEGTITSGASGEGLLGSEMAGARTLVKCLDEVADDARVKAVILRINSPGGSAAASERIHQAVAACAKRKPVIASISGLGASGGYYIALGAHRIIADPAAITGSVGVISGKMAIGGLLGKLGITTYEITRGQNAGLRTSREWTPREEAVVRGLAERTYQQFVDRVRTARGKRIKDVDAVVQGRVFTARQATDNGLIDGVGGLKDAVLAAQQAAKIDSSFIIVLPRPRTLADLLNGADGVSAPPLPTGRTEALELLARARRGAARSGRLAGAAYLLNLAAMLEGESTLLALPHFVAVIP
jgi:protease-4